MINNIKKVALVLLLGFGGCAKANDAIDFSVIHQVFVDAAQGHQHKSELKMNNKAVIVGTKAFDEKNKQYHLDFPKLHSNGESKCYVGLDANGNKIKPGATCTVTGKAGNNYPLGKYNPPLWLRPKFNKAGLSELKLQGKTTRIPAGDYWMDELTLDNASLFVSGKGEANIYVKEDITLNDRAVLGSLTNPINIFSYGEQIDINNGVTLFGNVKAKERLSINGGSLVTLLGEIQAKEVVFNASQINIATGNHWFKELVVDNRSKVVLQGEGSTVFNIEHGLELNDDSQINIKNSSGENSEHSLLILYYRDHHLEIANRSKVRAYIYTPQKLKINDATIYGAVSVGELDMEGGSIEYQRLFFSGSDAVHHYRLNYQPAEHLLTAIACKDNLCSETYNKPISYLTINDAINGNKQLARFTNFTEQSSATIANKVNACMQFSLIKDTGASPYPNAEPPLQCYIGNALLADCKVCDKPIPLFGYVQGEAIIPAVSAVTDTLFTIESYQGAAGLFEFGHNNKQLTVKDRITLPLSVSHSQAGQVTLLLSDDTGRQYEVQLGFVPKQLVWVSDLDINACGEQDSAFIYAQHANSCQAQGAVGDNLQFTIEARDINGNKISGYQAELGTIATINELNEHHQPPSSSMPAPLVVSFNGQNNDSASVNYTPHQVGLINATIHTHTSPYGKRANGESMLLTEGDTKVLGRSVPHSLSVEGSAGEILNGFAYRAKAVDFSTLPSFLVTGCAKSSAGACAMLPSFSGEFAKGLAHSANVEFSLAPNPNGPAYTLTGAQGATVSFDQQGVDGQWRSALGQHVIQPNDLLELVFAKENPSSVQKLTQQLRLSLDIAQDSHQHQARPRGEGQAPLDNKDAQLRYGFLTLHDLELATHTAGSVTAHLNYYDKDLNTLKEDDSSVLLIPSSLSPFVLKPAASGLTEPTLTLNDKVITISEYASEWEGEVELSTPAWLKPYDQESCGVDGCLINPQFHLHITEQSRKRQFDRIFNRREVVR